MKKKLLLITSTVSVGVIGALMLTLSPRMQGAIVQGDLAYEITLDDKSAVASADSGKLHRVTIKENMFDLIGWTNEGEGLGSIKKAACGDFIYNGMIYNRSLINGFNSLTVTFTGGTLYYVFTDFLMEDMTFSGHSTLVSGEPVAASNKAYFVVYNKSETPVNIESLKVNYSCNYSIDDSLIYKKSDLVGHLGGARSNAKSYTLKDNLIEMENNPTKTQNNYSVGKTGGHEYNDSWYRWNGQYLPLSKDLGTDFTFGMTIIGDFDRVVDTSKNFHYGVWPQFTFGNTTEERKENAEYEMIYIGNDNYEPLGKDHALHPSDPYIGESYAGRFFTKYEAPLDATWYVYDETTDDYYKDGGVYKTFSSKQAARDFIKTLPLARQEELGAYTWDATFYDPDETNVIGSSTKLRDAYAAYDLPFWFVKFVVHMEDNGNGDVVPFCDSYINGFHIVSSEIFYKYDTVNNPSVKLQSLPLHIVNYGIDAEGNPDASYHGTFTYPRLIA